MFIKLSWSATTKNMIYFDIIRLNSYIHLTNKLNSKLPNAKQVTLSVKCLDQEFNNGNLEVILSLNNSGLYTKDIPATHSSCIEPSFLDSSSMFKKLWNNMLFSYLYTAHIIINHNMIWIGFYCMVSQYINKEWIASYNQIINSHINTQSISKLFRSSMGHQNISVPSSYRDHKTYKEVFWC